jgi:hypothetical protein
MAKPISHYDPIGNKKEQHRYPQACPWVSITKGEFLFKTYLRVTAVFALRVLNALII